MEIYDYQHFLFSTTIPYDLHGALLRKKDAGQAPEVYFTVQTKDSSITNDADGTSTISIIVSDSIDA